MAVMHLKRASAPPPPVQAHSMVGTGERGQAQTIGLLSEYVVLFPEENTEQDQ